MTWKCVDIYFSTYRRNIDIKLTLIRHVMFIGKMLFKTQMEYLTLIENHCLECVEAIWEFPRGDSWFSLFQFYLTNFIFSWATSTLWSRTFSWKWQDYYLAILFLKLYIDVLYYLAILFLKLYIDILMRIPCNHLLLK